MKKNHALSRTQRGPGTLTPRGREGSWRTLPPPPGGADLKKKPASHAANLAGIKVEANLLGWGG